MFAMSRGLSRVFSREQRRETRDEGRPVVINAGSGRATSICDIARLVVAEAKRLKKKPPEIVSKKIPKETIAADRWLSIAKARKQYGWKPRITLNKGIRELFYEKQIL